LLVVAFVALAAGELSEDEIADWFRQRVTQTT
jgi:death-on-curing protein